MGYPLEIALRIGKLSEFCIFLCLVPCLYVVLNKYLLTELVRLSQCAKKQ